MGARGLPDRKVDGPGAPVLLVTVAGLVTVALTFPLPSVKPYCAMTDFHLEVWKRVMGSLEKRYFDTIGFIEDQGPRGRRCGFFHQAGGTASC